MDRAIAAITLGLVVFIAMLLADGENIDRANFNAGHQEATETITKACADKGYFKVGILTYQCSQLFVVDE